MDMGAIVKAPLDDSEWIKKCVIIGLLFLIPIVGALNMLGWQVAYTRTRLAGGTQLPDADLSYIGPGFWAMLSMLPLIAVMVVVMIGVAICGGIASQLGSVGGLLMLVVGLISVVLYLGILVVSPLFLYRYIVHNDAWAGARVGWAFSVLKANAGAVVMLWVALIVASIVGSLGSIVVIGFIITMPLGQAMAAAAIAEFANTTNRV